MTNQSFTKILEFEDGKLTDEEIIHLFSDLIDSGDIWKLPSNYGDMASILIASGNLNTKHNQRIN